MISPRPVKFSKNFKFEQAIDVVGVVVSVGVVVGVVGVVVVVGAVSGVAIDVVGVVVVVVVGDVARLYFDK